MMAIKRVDTGAFAMSQRWDLSHAIRLSPKDAADLRFLWGEYESSSLRAISYENMGAARGALGGSWDPFEHFEPWSASRRAEVRMAERARRTLAKVLPIHQCVLFAFYAPRRPEPALGAFGDLAGILKYVPAVERLAAGRRGTLAEIIAKRILEPGGIEFVRSTKAAAERVLSLACEAYTDAKVSP